MEKDSKQPKPVTFKTDAFLIADPRKKPMGMNIRILRTISAIRLL